MKKIFSMMMVLLMVFVVGCSSTPAPESTTESATTESATTEAADSAATGKVAQIKEAGKLVIGTSADYPPYEFHMMIDGKDTIVGFDIDLAQEIAKHLGVELEIQDMGFDAVLAGVGTGLIDLGIAGINPTPDRDEAMDFSDVYYKASHTILIRAEDADKFKTKEDLKGATIGAQIGTVQESVGKEELTESTIKSLGKVTDLVVELKTGMIDGILLEMPVAASYAKQNPDLVDQTAIVFEKMEGGSTVITANGEEELMAEVNTVIAQLIKDGKMDEFVAKANELAEQAAE